MSNTYLINPVVSLDGQHVMSNSEDYDKLTSFFSSEVFANTVQDRELDKALLAELSQEYTNYLREQDQFEWSGTGVAVVSRMTANALENVTQEAIDGEADDAVFRIAAEVAILSVYGE
ncbi:MAG: hypothetical protein JXR12_15270 [Neptunomonas phycophila]|uniref:hypothetical protein n=1 Tax=Neptunomonas phycophila TaxID=1572645 RepID=UPI003B8B5EA6